MDGRIERVFRPGELVKHFKGGLYRVLGTAKHTETGETMMIYKDERNEHQVYCRPYDIFCSEVDRDKYPSVLQKYRMEKIGICVSTQPL